MGKRDLLDELPVRSSENICTGCYTVPPEWYRDDEIERCAECDSPRDDSEPALSLDEDELEKALS